MEIHRYEKFWFAASLLLIVAFIATITFGAVGAGISMVDDDGGTVDPDNLGEHERFGNPGVFASDQEGIDYEVNMRAFHPAFVPSTVEIPEGSTVQFYITSQDVIHGYEVVGTNVNTMVIPGQVSKFTAEFDEPKEYGVLCNEYCGSLHHEMEGKLVVVEEQNWDPETMLDGGES
jgi:cytochrome c oxidase subunit 2